VVLAIRDARLPSVTLWRQQREMVAQETGGPSVGASRANGGIDASGTQGHPSIRRLRTEPLLQGSRLAGH